MIGSIIAAVAAFILTVLGLLVFLPKLNGEAAQPINTNGPVWHLSKAGTPTFGGIFFTGASVIVFAAISLIFNDKCFSIRGLISFGACLLFAGVGFLDDFIKIKRKDNKGLSAVAKLLMQFAVSTCYVSAMALSGNMDTIIRFHFSGDEADIGFFYYIIAVIFITGIVNSVNITDGIDGLAASVTSVIMTGFTVMFIISEQFDGSFMSAMCFGGCIGFLLFNAHPAKIFMGDTGSHFLGGMCAVLAFMSGTPLIILLSGIIFIIEMLSDIIQVTYKKITHGKKLFKMAPIHHHFEMCGVREETIVLVASLITVLATLFTIIF